MNSLREDLRFSLRSLVRRPGFAAVTILTLALGIGANTAIFSVIHEVVLSELPYPQPEELVKVQLKAVGGAFSSAPGGFMELPWSYPLFTDLREYSSGFEDLAAWFGFQFNLIGAGEPERIPVELVSATYLPLLGIEAAEGRVIAAEEDATPGSHPVIVLGHGLWQRRFGGDPGAIGKVIYLDDVPLTVIGVLPPGFRGLSGNAQAWVPMMMAPDLMMPRRLEQRFAHWHEVVGRLTPGMTVERASEAVTSALSRGAEANPVPDFYGALQSQVVSLQEASRDPELNRGLLLLFAAVGLVFFIACVNVVSLLLVRTIGRRRELALRTALGGSRRSLLRLFSVESLVLGVAGGLVGLLVAYFGIQIFAAFSPVAPVTKPLEIAAPDAIQLEAVHLGLEVLAINFLLAVVAGLVLGLLPVLQLNRIDVNRWIRGDGGALGTGVKGLRRFSPLSLLVVVEIALCVVLLIGAGLLLRSLAQLQATPLGFEAESLLTLSISRPFGEEESPERLAFYRQLLERVGGLPGVEAVSVTNRLPVSLGGETARVTVAGRELPEGAQPPAAGVHKIAPGYLEALTVPLIQGRPLSVEDREGAPRVALVNQAGARELFPGQQPLGQRVQLSIGWGEDEFAEIVGVVGDVHYETIEEDAGPAVYIPFFQDSTSYPFLLVRSTGAPERLIAPVRQAVLDLDPRIPVFDVKTMEQRIEALTSKERFMTLLLSTFAAVAFLLAAVGLYGVLSYSVSSRTLEIGVRSAIGAEPGSVFAMVIKDALLLSLIGLVVGLALALALTRWLTSFLFELSSLDPLTFAAASVLLLAVVVLAAAIPAGRAVRVDPRTALRSE